MGLLEQQDQVSLGRLQGREAGTGRREGGGERGSMGAPATTASGHMNLSHRRQELSRPAARRPMPSEKEIQAVSGTNRGQKPAVFLLPDITEAGPQVL